MPSLIIGSDIGASSNVGGFSGMPVAPPPDEITATITPKTSHLFEGQSVSDMAMFAEMTAPTNFNAPGTVRAEDITISIFGVEGGTETPLDEGGVVRYQVSVTDDLGSPPALFDTQDVTVEYAVRFGITGDNTVNIDINPLVPSDEPIDIEVTGLTGTSAVYNGLYTAIPAGSFASGQPPYNFAGTVQLSHDSTAGQPTTGDTLSVDTGLWANTVGTLAIDYQIRREAVAVGAPGESYILQPGDDGAVFDAVVVATDGQNDPVSIISNSISAARDTSALNASPIFVQTPESYSRTETIASVDLSDALAGEQLFFGVSLRDNANDYSVISLTLAGVTATKIAETSNPDSRGYCAWFTLVKPTADTADIVITSSETVGHGQLVVFKVPGANPVPRATAQAMNVNPAAINIETANGGTVLMNFMYEAAPSTVLSGLQTEVSYLNGSTRTHGFAFENVTTGESARPIALSYSGSGQATAHLISLEAL